MKFLKLPSGDAFSVMKLQLGSTAILSPKIMAIISGVSHLLSSKILWLRIHIYQTEFITHKFNPLKTIRVPLIFSNFAMLM